MIIKDDIQIKRDKIGNLTKQYIEKNREILKEQKQEASSENYEPTWNYFIINIIFICYF